MIKFVHFPEPHFTNNHLYGKVNPATKLNTRFEDQLNNFNLIISNCIKQKVDFVLIPGDVYNNENPISKVRTKVAESIKRLTNKKITVFIITGNHDMIDKEYNSLSDIQKISNKYIKIFSKETFYRFKKHNLMMLFIPYPINESYKDINKRLKNKWNKIPIDIILAHIDVKGTLPDFIMKHGVKKKLLSYANYTALGHIHGLRKLTYTMYYSGGLIRNNFGERGYDVGYIYAKIERYKNTLIAKPKYILDRKFIKIRDGDSLFNNDLIPGNIIKLISKPEHANILRRKLYRMGAFYVDVGYKKEKTEIQYDSKIIKNKNVFDVTCKDLKRFILKTPFKNKKLLYKKSKNLLDKIEL